MTDWLAFSRGCVQELERVLADLPSRIEREPVLRAGEGGDDTTAIDAAAEDVVVRRLEALGIDLTLVSEELGIRTFGGGGELRVVVDPIDGSVNAKRGIPYFSLSTSSSASSTTSGRARSGSRNGAAERASAATHSTGRGRRRPSRFSRSRGRRPRRSRTSSQASAASPTVSA